MRENRVAIITGGSRGIGKACALRLAQDKINIVVNYNKNEDQAKKVVEEVKNLGCDAIAIKADVSKSSEVRKLFKEGYEYFGRIDILVNNAGIVQDSFIMMLGDSDLDETIDVNVKSYFYCCKQAALKMFKNKTGKIINISSVSSIKGIPGQSVYSASKGAVNSLTRVLARELGGYGISVNAIAPGFIETDMVNDISEEMKKELCCQIPFKRFGNAEEVADCVGFLCQESTSYITGQVIVIDGGLSV